MATAVAPARAGAAPAKSLRPFRYGTRQRFAAVPIASGGSYSSGGSFFAELPRVGFLSHIFVRLAGIMNLGTNGGALKARGPWDLLARLRVRTSMGAATIYDTTGYGNYVVQRLLARHVDLASDVDADLYAAPVAQGDNSWVLTYIVPVAHNLGAQSALGLINLQAPEVQVTLEGTYGAPADVVTNVGTGFTGSLSAGYLYYEVPDPREVMYPPLVLHRIIESRQIITAVGDQVYTAPREGILHRLVHIVQQNDARTNAVDRLVIRFNKTDEVYRYDRWQLKVLQKVRYALPLPTGVFAHDFWAADGAGEPGYGDQRDMISSEALSTLESIVTTTGTLGGTLNALDTIREFAQFVSL
jgi:hypothetical protein